MNLQDQICKAFCADVRVNAFPGGFGVSTPFMNPLTGDTLGFYVVGPEGGRYRVIDDALTVIHLEAAGANFDTATRKQAFAGLLHEYGAEYDEHTGEIFIQDIPQAGVERKSLDFMALLLRVQDMQMLSRESVQTTFFDDVQARLNAVSFDGYSFESKTPVSDNLSDVIPDFVLRRTDHRPVALFLGSTSEKLWQAMLLRSIARHEAKTQLSVVAMLENDTSATSRLRAQASNRLDAVTYFRGSENDAIERVLDELDISTTSLH